jgi:hypothetical protein
MYDFASRVAAAEEFPSFVFSFKPLDPAVLEYHAPVPESMNRTVG